VARFLMLDRDSVITSFLPAILTPLVSSVCLEEAYSPGGGGA